MENLFLTSRLIILSLLVCGIFPRTNMKVSPSVWGENPLSVVSKSKSLWVRVPYVSPSPSAQNIIKKGFTPKQQLNNKGGKHLDALEADDPRSNIIQSPFLPETYDTALLRKIKSYLQSSLTMGQRYRLPPDNRTFTLAKTTRINQKIHLICGIHAPAPLHAFPVVNHTTPKSKHNTAPTTQNEHTTIKSHHVMNKKHFIGKILRTLATVSQKTIEYSKNDILYSKTLINIIHMALQEVWDKLTELVLARTTDSTTHANRVYRTGCSDPQTKGNAQMEITYERKTKISNITRPTVQTRTPEHHGKAYAQPNTSEQHHYHTRTFLVGQNSLRIPEK